MSEVGKIKITMENPMDSILENYESISSKSNTHSSDTKKNSMKIESFDVSSFTFNNRPTIHEDFVKIMSIDKSSLPSEEELEMYYNLLNSGKSSLSQEEYLLYVKGYQYERNQELESYQDLLKIVNEEIENKKEIRKACEDWKNSIEELQLSTENYTLNLINRYKEMVSYDNQKENELLNEELKQYDLTIQDIESKTTEELIEAFKSKNEEVKKRYNEIERQKQLLDSYTKQETEFQNYEAFQNYVLEMDESKILLESAIKTTNKLITSAEYSHLSLLEDYQTYENKEEIVTSLEGYQNKDGVFYKNLSQVDALSRASELNPELGKIYNYLYETQGKEKANDYLNKMEETLNQINGQVNAEKFLSTLKDEKELTDYLENHIKVGGKGIGDGIGSFYEGIGDWLTGKNFYSESEYETMYILQALQGDSEKHYDWALQHNYNMTQSMGNMLPSIALSMLLTPVGGSVASTVGSASMGISAGGKSYHNALVEGHDTARSVFYGVLNGVSEAALQKLVGGIVGLSDVEVVDLKSLATSMLHEGLEEGSQEYLDALFKYGLWNEKQDFSELSQNAFVSAIYGGLTAGAMNGVGLGVNKIANLSDAHVFGENLGENQISEEVNKLHSINEKAEVEILEDFEIDNVLDVNSNIYQNQNLENVTVIESVNNDLLNQIVENVGDSFGISSNYDATLQIVNTKDLFNILENEQETKKLIEEFETKGDTTSLAYINGIVDLYNLINGKYTITKQMENNYKSLKKYSNIVDDFNTIIKSIPTLNGFSLNGNYFNDYLFNEARYNQMLDIINESNFKDKINILTAFHNLIEYLDGSTIIDLDTTTKNRLRKLNQLYFNNLNYNCEFFREFKEFGVNQNAVRKLALNPNSNKKIYVECENIVKKYFPNISKMKINTLLKGMDVIGMCSYASILNEIVLKYNGKEELFKNDFGYDLYRIEKGVKVFNAELLLTDLYCFANEKNAQIINKKGLWYQVAKDDKNKIYISDSEKRNITVVNDWLASKNIQNVVSDDMRINWTLINPNETNIYPSTEIFKDKLGNNHLVGLSPEVVLNFPKTIAAHLANGENCSIDIFSTENNDYTLYAPSNADYNSYLLSSDPNHGTGHSMNIVGLTQSNDIIVTSWGKEYFLKLHEISHALVDIHFSSWKE
ncbi:MAG: hypothetical protein HFJ02_00505 [Bacilli bacterium]|nr:hypothetical protein [Bacilli bacterium]